MRKGPAIAISVFATAIFVNPTLSIPVDRFPGHERSLGVSQYPRGSFESHWISRAVQNAPDTSNSEIPGSRPHRFKKRKHRTLPRKRDISVTRRAGDGETAGGNAYTGHTSSVDGGKVVNEADGEVDNSGGSESRPRS